MASSPPAITLRIPSGEDTGARQHADSRLKEGSEHPMQSMQPRSRTAVFPRSASASHAGLDTPSGRTGPPRSIRRSLPSSPIIFGNGSAREEPEEYPFDSTLSGSEFRGALDIGTPDPTDRKGKRRESSHWDASWMNPMQWFGESPKGERANSSFQEDEQRKGEDAGKLETAAASPLPPSATEDPHPSPSSPARNGLHRANSSPHPDHHSTIPHRKWGLLRSLLPTIAQQAASSPPNPSAVASTSVNIVDELMVGGLSPLLLRLWFERDEKDHRRIPVLLHRLRIRITDSLYALDGRKAVFRIECEYANGAARWVIYRQLRDFISLHAHYRVATAYNRNPDVIPEFPRTSLPYFKFLSRERGHVSHSDFARLQRSALEDYLVDLMRAMMFHPSSNRLAGFLEISALFISLAKSGGCQYKAGFLRIEAVGPKASLGRKSSTWREKKASRWCAVRDSYLVVLEESGELTIWDVFLLDKEFKIERAKRYYRQRLHFLHPEDNTEQGHQAASVRTTGTISRISKKVFDFILRRSKSAEAVVTAPSNSLHHVESSSGGSDESRSPSPPSPMLDPSTNVNPLVPAPAPGDEEQDEDDEDEDQQQQQQEQQEQDKKRRKKRTTDVSKHTLYIENSQMRLKLFARSERQMLQWITALEKIAATSHFARRNRFDSFAPIRLNAAAQWLVDGRDYFWNLSRAILLAHESIYIHGWWLSPELEMRRPNKSKYRIDKLLERKAKEGVKIYVILYQEVSSRTTPTDSTHAKQRLLALHPNIMIQRSPSHFSTGTFYWAHHEKMCVIDQTIAFMGGLDICFGRWDTPQHVLTDDADSQIWHGKDYSNARVSDFYALDKPDEDMYDRSKIPRMPWHDVSMQVLGQPARDLARHFVERWNYLLRIKNHSRAMPFLLPPPDFKPGELTRMGLTGTCEMQICRSAGPWSLGTLNQIEYSIQNAYLKAIQMSEHFVYIENQFFITSTVVGDVKVENRIGDALVHRIIKADRDGTPWKCCIMIPLMPGFSFSVDNGDASALRIIMECQSRTIARGPNSIFARLRKNGINPDDYISVFSLRNWAKLRGVLTTEMVYIHSKICIVDDRLAIIGSANINERSLRGDRDSELAAVIRDTDMIDSTMAGKPFKVGRFAHTLRVRLMREHLGVDVDAIEQEDLMNNEPVVSEEYQQPWDPDSEQTPGQYEGITRVKPSKFTSSIHGLSKATVGTAGQAGYAAQEAGVGLATKVLHKMGVRLQDVNALHDANALDEERTTFTSDGEKVRGFASSVVPTLEEKTISEHPQPHTQQDRGATSPTPQDSKQEYKESVVPEQIKEAQTDRMESAVGVEADAKPAERLDSETTPQPPNTLNGELFGPPATTPKTDDDPRQVTSATNKLSAQEEAIRPALRKDLNADLRNKTWTLPVPAPNVDPHGFDDPLADSFWNDMWVASAVHNTEIYRRVFHAIPDDLITTWKQYKDFVLWHERFSKPYKEDPTAPPVASIPSEAGPQEQADGEGGHKKFESSSKHGNGGLDGSSTNGASSLAGNPAEAAGGHEDASKRRAPRLSGTEPFERWERDKMEELLGDLVGNLVIHPMRFLEAEDMANNFLFNADRLLPMPIYL